MGGAAVLFPLSDVPGHFDLWDCHRGIPQRVAWKPSVHAGCSMGD